MQVKFKNVENSKVKNSFLKVVRRYKELHECQITLKQGRIKSSTMQAQPVINLKSFFRGPKRYRVKLAIYVRDSNDIRVDNLPEEVLTGWFAHELGHIVDYESFSSLQMIGYGIKYILSEKFKKKAEHAADMIAVRYGFRNEILATKRFLMENDFLGESYKIKLNKYYMSIADVEMCSENGVLGNTIIELGSA